MKVNDPTRTNVDKAIMNLIVEGIQRYELKTKPVDQISIIHVDELLELAMDLIGDTNRNIMFSLPIEKKVRLILQMTVLLL
jgi:hypothetical protein